MATNEGLQPVSNDQVPIDPNVRIPDHVRQAAERAEAFYKAAPDPAAEAAAAEAAAAEAGHAAHAEAQRALPEAQTTTIPPQEQTLPADDNLPAAEWRNRYLSMKGRYDKAMQTIGSMEQQMAELGQELVRTQQMLAQSAPQTAQNHVTSQINHNNLITEEDRANYGDELIDLARRAASSVVGPELEQLRAENQRLTSQVKKGTRRDLFVSLDQQLPTWRQINNDVRFKTWLRLPNVYTGQVRKAMLDAAVDGADAPKVLQFFKDFLTEANATGQMAPAQQTEQQTHVAPRPPAVALETLAAPGKARPASGDNQAPSEKPIYSRADITKFYADSRKGLYAGREAEYNATQADLTRAQVEGRIRG